MKPKIICHIMWQLLELLRAVTLENGAVKLHYKFHKTTL